MSLLKKIDKLSSLVHSRDLEQYHLDSETIAQLKEKLDELSTHYIRLYC